MKALCWLVLSAVLVVLPGVAARAAATAAAAADERPSSPWLSFEGGRSTSYGVVYQFGEVESVFRFVNEGPEPVEILGVDFALLGGEATWEPEVVPPGGRGEVRFRQPVGDKLGAFTLRHGLRTTDPGAPRVKLNASGFILSAFEPEVGRVDLGRVDRATGGHAVFELISREAASLGPVRVLEAPEWLTVEPSNGGDGQTVQIEVGVGPDAPLGFHIEKVTLATGLAEQPVYPLEVRVAVHGEVVPSADPVQLGVLRQFEPSEATVTLRHRGGEAIEVERVEIEEPFTAEVEPCPHPADRPADPACQLLVLRAEPQERGGIDAWLLAHLTGWDEPVPVRYSGMVAGPGTVIQSLGELELGTVVHSDGRIERLADGELPPPVPVPEAPGDAVPADAAAEPPASPAGQTGPSGEVGARAKLTWRVRREDQVYGFLVYRSEDRSGPYVRVGSIVRAAKAATGQVRGYEFVDRDVEPGRTYHYYVDTVTRSGLKQRLTGVVSKTVAPDGRASAELREAS